MGSSSPLSFSFPLTPYLCFPSPKTVPHHTMQCNTMQFNAMQYNTMPYNTKQYNATQYNTMQYHTIQYNTMPYNTIQPRGGHASLFVMLMRKGLACISSLQNVLPSTQIDGKKCNFMSMLLNNIL